MDLELKKNKMWYCGVDNARRQEVLGSLIIAGCVVPESDFAYLKELGVNDSKKLTERQINKLGKLLKSKYDHTVYRISAEEISKSSNINVSEAKYILEIVQKYHSRIDMFFIDAVGSTPDLLFKYKPKLLDFIDKITTEPRADETYIPCMVASIIAKYEGNSETIYWKNKLDCGSGGPSDPLTLLYILNNLNNKQKLIRTNWITYTRINDNPQLQKDLKRLITSKEYRSNSKDLKELYKKHS